jgi:hypothetical protein
MNDRNSDVRTGDPRTNQIVKGGCSQPMFPHPYLP